MKMNPITAASPVVPSHVSRAACRTDLFALLLGAAAMLGVHTARAAVTFPMYVSSGSQSIVQVSSAGVVSPFATLPANSNPLGLAFDGSGNLYEADFNGSNHINKITPGGST